MRERPSSRMPEGMTETVVDQCQDQHPGLDHIQELALVEIKLAVISVGNMTTLQVNAQTVS